MNIWGSQSKFVRGEMLYFQIKLELTNYFNFSHRTNQFYKKNNIINKYF